MKNLPLLAFILLAPISLFGQKISQKELLGSYTLERIDYIYQDTTIQVNPSQNGFLIISPDRYAIAYNPGLKPRVAFENLSKPSDEEILAGFRSFAFNSGSYEIKNNELIIKPDFAKVPGFEGGEQVYRISQIGDSYTFTMYDETYPNNEKPSWYGKLEIKLYFQPEKG